MTQLAIVIPAYKSTFLEATLTSLANQTNKNFNVYIGDDCSPSDLGRIIKKFHHKLKIKYVRFNSNFGGGDLIAQWERCIDLVQEEKWIWFFSDDDVMGKNCVQVFYDQIEQDDSYDLYHCNVRVINEKGLDIKDRYNSKYPDVLDVKTFYKKRLSGRIKCFVVEFVFKKETFLREGRFQHFDLAWSSDVATWMKIGFKKGIKTINQDANIYWRKSSANISPDNSGEMPIRKIKALSSFLKWSNDFFKSKDINMSLFNFNIFIKRLNFFSKYIGKPQVNELIISFFSGTKIPVIAFPIIIYFNFYQFIYRLKQRLF